MRDFIWRISREGTFQKPRLERGDVSNPLSAVRAVMPFNKWRPDQLVLVASKPQGRIMGEHVPLSDDPSVVIDRELDQEKGLDPSGPRIRSPNVVGRLARKTAGRLTAGTSWNTFDTGGVCSACLHQWASTQCLKCGGWSPHSDWYEQ
jgi:hypothetical protein